MASEGAVGGRGDLCNAVGPPTSIRKEVRSQPPDDWLERNLYTHATTGAGAMLLIDIAFVCAIEFVITINGPSKCCGFGVCRQASSMGGTSGAIAISKKRLMRPPTFRRGASSSVVKSLHNNHHTYPTSPCSCRSSLLSSTLVGGTSRFGADGLGEGSQGGTSLDWVKSSLRPMPKRWKPSWPAMN